MFIFDKQYKRYYDDAFQFLYSFRFTKLSKKDQKKYQDFLINALEDDDIRKNAHRIYQAIQTMRQCEEISHKPLDRAVKKYNESFYEIMMLTRGGNILNDWLQK